MERLGLSRFLRDDGSRGAAAREPGAGEPAVGAAVREPAAGESVQRSTM